LDKTEVQETIQENKKAMAKINRDYFVYTAIQTIVSIFMGYIMILNILKGQILAGFAQFIIFSFETYSFMNVIRSSTRLYTTLQEYEKHLYGYLNFKEKQ